VIKMDCIFCKIIKGEIPGKIVYEDDLVIVIMDASPIVDGHMLIIPKKHYIDYMELDENITSHIFKVAQIIGKKVFDKLNTKSLTISVNYGDDQKVKHVHFHILPELGTTNISKAKFSIEENFLKLKA